MILKRSLLHQIPSILLSVSVSVSREVSILLSVSALVLRKVSIILLCFDVRIEDQPPSPGFCNIFFRKQPGQQRNSCLMLTEMLTKRIYFNLKQPLLNPVFSINCGSLFLHPYLHLCSTW